MPRKPPIVNKDNIHTKKLKKVKTKKMTKEMAEAMILSKMGKNYKQKPFDITEGDKIQLNVNSMKERPDWKSKTDRFKTFVEENADKIFTVEFDSCKNGKTHSNSMVVLKEDESDPKWLFWIGDFIKIEITS